MGIACNLAILPHNGTAIPFWCFRAAKFIDRGSLKRLATAIESKTGNLAPIWIAAYGSLSGGFRLRTMSHHPHLNSFEALKVSGINAGTSPHR